MTQGKKNTDIDYKKQKQNKPIPHTEWSVQNWEEINKLLSGVRDKKGDGLPDSIVKSDENSHWIFRGDKRRKCESEWGLETKLEKAFKRFKPEDKKDAKGKNYTWQGLEWALIREFQRKASLYVDHPPARDDILEWLALMQHYGAPTRLLDWVYSPFIALYFAVNQLDCKDEEGIVSALNTSFLPSLRVPKDIKKRIRREKRRKEFFDKIQRTMLRHKDLADMRKDKLVDNTIVHCLMKFPLSLVYNVTPYILNPRLTVQQGTFLFPGDIKASFEDNLKSSIGKSQKAMHRIVIKVDVTERNDILRKLKDRNIHQAALFPDLDGFAESLWTKLAYPEQLGIEAKD